MQAGKDIFYNLIESLDTESLREKCRQLYDENRELAMQQAASEKVNTATYIQYSSLKERCEKLEKENAWLKELLEKEIEKYNLRIRSTFGRKTESTLALIDSAAIRAEEFDDESQTEDVREEIYSRKKTVDITGLRRGKKTGKNGGTDNSVGKHRVNRLAESMDRLPRELCYDINPDELDNKYGRGNWRIAFWHKHESLEKIDSPYYARVVYTPVISEGLEHMLRTAWFENPLIDRSVVSPSLMADILYRKFVLSMPFNRQAADYNLQGIGLSKQTIINWASRIVPSLFKRVVDYLTECLCRYKYIQNDETYIQVNKDSRGPGHKSYMWVHCSSELLDCNPIIIFCYEATRRTNHLRDFYGEFMGYITCDAYISYKVFEEESKGDVKVTGCLMHCRRYFAEAFFLNDISSMDDAQLKELPETKILFMIRDIYCEENLLRKLPADERLTHRQKEVKPLVDTLFSYIHGLDASGQIFSDRMKKALTYAINQEKYLRAFLDDGSIPCDNGNAERIIRSYSVGRANWLFADTVSGAELNAIMYSIVETAKANKVNVLIYLRYLLEELPKHSADVNREYLADMVPWSSQYADYEKSHIRKNAEKFRNLFPEPERPKTPKKKEQDKNRSSGKPA